MNDEQGLRRHSADPIAALPYDIGVQLINALRDSAALESPSLFVEIATWAQTALIFRDTPSTALTRAIDAMRGQVAMYVPLAHQESAREALRLAREELNVVRLADAPTIDDSTPHGEIARRFFDAIMGGDETRAAREVLLQIANGMKTIEVYEKIFTPVLHEAGRLWQRNELSVSDEHVITASVERLMAQLSEFTQGRPHRDLTIVSAAVGVSQHQVGARMVADAFAMCGWQATYLGSSIPPEDLIKYLDRFSVDVLALSGTLVHDVMPIRSVIDALAERPVAPVVLVGGRVFANHPALWKAIGADGYAATPLMAVAVANELVSHCDS